MLLRCVVVLLSQAVLGAGAELAAQDFPNRPVRIVTADVGAASDFAARVIAQELTPKLGQQVIVDNRSGAAPASTVARAQPDGHTLLLHGGSFWLAPFLQKVPYDVARDFLPIATVGRSFFVLVEPVSMSSNSVKELIAVAKAKPGELNYASGASGVPTHLAAELFKSMAAVNIVRIPYKGTGPALNGLLAGEAHLLFALPGTVGPHVKSGKLKTLGVSSTSRTQLAPGVPTIAESGVPGYEVISALGVFVPAKTPASRISLLNQEIDRVLNSASVKEKFFVTGIETVGGRPGQLAAIVASESTKWGKLIKDVGIHED